MNTTQEIKRNSLTSNAMSDYKFKVHASNTGRLPVLFQHFAALYSTVPNSIKAKQELFQAPNDLPVWLKGGPKDKILFGVTVGLIGIGLANVVHTFYGMMYPKKK